jgi:hypothetical protein
MGSPEHRPTLVCLICYRFRACRACGHTLFDLVPRSIDPIWLRCCKCGSEMAVPMHDCPGAP